MSQPLDKDVPLRKGTITVHPHTMIYIRVRALVSIVLADQQRVYNVNRKHILSMCIHGC